MMLLSRLAYCLTKAKPNSTKQVTFKSWQILKGDNVVLLNGRDKGKQGAVTKVYRKSNQVVVDGINIKHKITRSKEDKIEKKPLSYPVHVSKVSLIDPEEKKPTRIFYAFRKDTGEKVRIAKKSGAIIPKPNREQLTRAARGKSREAGAKDTPAAKVLEVTYTGEDL